MFNPEIVYIEDNGVVKLEPLEIDENTEINSASVGREKIGDIYRTSSEHLAFVCAHCAAEFPLFNQFILHNQQHLQSIKSCLLSADNLSKEIDSSNYVRLEPESDVQMKQEVATYVVPDPIVDHANSRLAEEHRAEKDVKSMAVEDTQTEKKCLECGLQFKASSSLSRHMALHKQERRYLCDTCPESFARSDKLLVHKRTHSRDYGYKCDWCPRSYPGKRTLKKHVMQQHTGEQSIICAQCGLQFTSQSGLNRHMPTHTKERKYLCDMCPKSYLRSDKLLAHRRSHRNEFIYTCKWCDKGFPEKRSLKRHTISKHGKEWDEDDPRVHDNNKSESLC